jgi:hypothetical protein
MCQQGQGSGLQHLAHGLEGFSAAEDLHTGLVPHGRF